MPKMARIPKINGSPILAFFQLLDKGLNIGFGLFIGKHSEIIQIAMDRQTGDSGNLREPLGHTVTAVRVVGAGFGIVVDDAVNLEKRQHFFDVFFLGFIVTHDNSSVYALAML